VLHQEVALGEQGDQGDAHHVRLADDDALDVGGDATAQVRHVAETGTGVAVDPGAAARGGHDCSSGDLARSATSPPPWSSPAPRGGPGREAQSVKRLRASPPDGVGGSLPTLPHRVAACAPRAPYGGRNAGSSRVDRGSRPLVVLTVRVVRSSRERVVPHLPPPLLTRGFPFLFRRGERRSELTVGRSGVMW